MIIRLRNKRIYRLTGTLIVDVMDGYAEVLALPERRRFVVSIDTARSALDDYHNDGAKTLADYLVRALCDGYLCVDDELI